MRNPLPIDKTTISHSSMTVVNFWIDYCNKNHPRCQNAGNMWQPTRLINVGTASAPVAHLIHTSTLPETVKYATLSHCWGDPKNAPVFRLLENNIEALQGALPIKELPCTFQETITLARILGISYLWIDSLCIIQESKSDWATESLTMGETYGNSHCNIAATGFPDSRRGIAVLRDPRNLQLREIQIKKPATEGQGVPPGSYFCVNEVWEDGIVTAPLNRRAWVFQERYLSPRILHFGACQLSWECMELEACEMFPLGLPNAFVTNYKKNSPFRVAYSTTSPLSHNDKSLLKSWCEAVSVYTRGDLTMEKDKLIAIAGIAEAMHRNLQCDYYSGLWQKGLPNHLLWLTRHLQAGKASRPESYIAPSWSWASLKGAVTFLDPGSGMTPYVTVLQCHVVSAVSQQFGQVSDGYLRLRGPLAQASFIESEEKLNSYTQNEPWHPVAFRTQGSEPRLTIKLTLHVDVYPQPKPGRFEMEFYANTNREAIGSRTFSY